MKAIITAAGLGSRFYPITKVVPKEFFPIGNRPVIDYVVEEAFASGISEVLIVVSLSKLPLFQAYYEHTKNIRFLVQERPEGLGAAILCAEAFIGNEAFVVMLGDDLVASYNPILKNLIDIYDIYDWCSIVSVSEVAKQDVCKYGIVDANFEESEYAPVKGLVEKPSVEDAPSQNAIFGRYLLQPEIFDCLRSTEVGVGGELQLTDALKKLSCLLADKFSGERFDTGNIQGYARAVAFFT